MGIRAFKLNTDELLFETDDAGMNTTEEIETLITEKLEEGFYDPKTGVTYYMSNGVFDIEPEG